MFKIHNKKNWKEHFQKQLQEPEDMKDAQKLAEIHVMFFLWGGFITYIVLLTLI